MSQIAFLCHPTVGHLNTLLSMALRLGEEGHSTRFFIPTAPSLPFRLRPDILNNAVDVPMSIERMGLALERVALPFATVFHAILLSRSSGYPEVRRAQSLFAGGVVPTARDIIRRMERQRPEVMVLDFTFHAGQLAAEKLGIPYVSIYHSGLPFRGPGVPPFGSGLPIGTADPRELRAAEAAEQELLGLIRGKLESARRELGLGPGPEDFLRSPSSPWLNLIPSHECLEAPRTGLGPSTFYIGPCFATRRGGAAEAFPFERLEPDAFKVYVSLGTVFNNRPEVFRTLIQALDTPGVQTIVSAGASYAELSAGKLPGNVLLFRRVPQVDLLPRVDLVIGHGGNNTTNETLASGKPLLVIPVGGEQQDNSRRVELIGAGVSLRPDRLSVDKVRQAVKRLREDPTFAQRARELQARLDETDGTGTAARLIAWLARNKAPLRTPEGTSRSLTREGAEKLLRTAPAA